MIYVVNKLVKYNFHHQPSYQSSQIKLILKKCNDRVLVEPQSTSKKKNTGPLI